MEGSVPSSLATSTHVSLGMHCVRCHSSSMAGIGAETEVSSVATRRGGSGRQVWNLSGSPGCKTRQRSAWSGASPARWQTRGCRGAAAVAGDTSTTSSRESLPAAATPPGWRPSAPSSPTASTPGHSQSAFSVTQQRSLSGYNSAFVVELQRQFYHLV